MQHFLVQYIVDIERKSSKTLKFLYVIVYFNVYLVFIYLDSLSSSSPLKIVMTFCKGKKIAKSGLHWDQLRLYLDRMGLNCFGLLGGQWRWFSLNIWTFRHSNVCLLIVCRDAPKSKSKPKPKTETRKPTTNRWSAQITESAPKTTVWTFWMGQDNWRSAMKLYSYKYHYFQQFRHQMSHSQTSNKMVSIHKEIYKHQQGSPRI